jgi:hypothetical protein
LAGSQESAIRICPESHDFSPHPHGLFLEIHFNIFTPYTPRSPAKEWRIKELFKSKKEIMLTDSAFPTLPPTMMAEPGHFYQVKVATISLS